MSSTTFLYRYETGWYGKDGCLENLSTYFSKKLDAMNFAQRFFANEPENFAATYVYDRCLNFNRWYDGAIWSRKQPALTSA